MILSMSNQAVLFFWTVAIGLASGFLYDAFRLLRHYIKHASFFIHMEDLLYWLFVSVVVFYVFLNKNYGEIRGFNILGVIIGMALYFAALSGFVYGGAKRLIDFLIRIVCFVARLLVKPLLAVATLLKRPVRFFAKIFGSLYISFKKLLQRFKNYVKMKGESIKRQIYIIAKKV